MVYVVRALLEDTSIVIKTHDLKRFKKIVKITITHYEVVGTRTSKLMVDKRAHVI